MKKRFPLGGGARVRGVVGRRGGGGTQTGAEIAAAIAAAGVGETVLISPIAGQTVTLSSLTKTGVIVERVGGSPLARMTLTSCFGITLDGLRFSNPNTAGDNPDADEASTATLIISASSNIRVTACAFDNAAASYDLNLQAIYVGTSTDIEIDNNTFTNISRAMSCVACGDGTLGNAVDFHDNTLTRFVSQGVRVAWSDCLIDENSFTAVSARTGRRLIGTITGTISVGDSISQGSGTSLEGGQVQAVGAGYVDVLYNSHEKPSALTTYVVNGAPANFIAVSSITTAYDPVHPDGIQAINNSATRDCILKIRRNLIGRGPSTFVTFPNIETDNPFPGIRVQQNTGGTWQWVNAEIDQNFLWNDHPEAMQIDGLDGGSARNNIAIQSSVTATDSPTRITILSGSVGTDASGNASNVTGGIVDSGTGTIAAGGVFLAPGDYASQLPLISPNSPPHTVAEFTPAVGSALALAGAGPLDATGAYQLYTPPATGWAYVTGNTTKQAAASSYTTSYSLAGSGAADQMLVVAVFLEDSSGSFFNVTGISWNGSALTSRIARVGGSLNRYQIWTLPIGSSSASSAVTVTMAGTGNRGIIIQGLILSGVNQGAPTDTTLSPTTWPFSSTAYTAPADGVVVGFFGDAGESVFSSAAAVNALVEPAPLTTQSCSGMLAVYDAPAGSVTVNAAYSAGASRAAGGALFLADA